MYILGEIGGNESRERTGFTYINTPIIRAIGIRLILVMTRRCHWE